MNVSCLPHIHYTITTETSLGYYHCSKPSRWQQWNKDNADTSGFEMAREGPVLDKQQKQILANPSSSYLRLCQRGVLIGKHMHSIFKLRGLACFMLYPFALMGLKMCNKAKEGTMNKHLIIQGMRVTIAMKIKSQQQL